MTKKNNLMYQVMWITQFAQIKSTEQDIIKKKLNSLFDCVLICTPMFFAINFRMDRPILTLLYDNSGKPGGNRVNHPCDSQSHQLLKQTISR